MKYWVRLFFLTGSLIASACNQVPKDVITEKNIVPLLVDIHLVDGYVFSLQQEEDALRQHRDGAEKRLKVGTMLKLEENRLRKKIDSLQTEIKEIDSLQVKNNLFFQSVYAKHHTNKKQLEQSLQYYSRKPELLDSIYTRVSRNLENRRKLEEIGKLNQRK